MRQFARSIWNRLRGQARPQAAARRTATRRLELETLEDRTLMTASANGTIAGQVYIDANNSGKIRASDTFLHGVVVDLTGTTTSGTPLTGSVTTNATGGYSFQNLLPGTYSTTVDSSQAVVTSGTVVLGGASTDSGLTITSNQSLAANLGTALVTPSRVSMRFFLTSTTPRAPLPAAGKGVDVMTYAPTVLKAIANVSVAPSASPTLVDLAANFTDPDFTDTTVQFNTDEGPIDILLYDSKAPQTVANFLDYVNGGLYNNDIFHRLAFNGTTPFVLQGGGFTYSANPSTLTAVTTFPAIENEFGASNTLVNGLSTIAMAKLGSNANSATSQFFFNLGNNSANLDNQNGGFTVFGQVANAASQAVINKFEGFTVTDESSNNSALNTLPLQNYTGTNFPTDTTANNFAIINSAQVISQGDFLTYSVVSNSNSAVVTPSITDERLTLTYPTTATAGTSTIVVKATNTFGLTVTQSFTVTVT